MMEKEREYNIGQTFIPYIVIERTNLTRKRLILTPYDMEVRVPKGTSRQEVREFLRSKEQWIIQSLDELRTKIPLVIFPDRFGPGSKILKWGRFVRLEFQKIATNRVLASGGSPIQVSLPMESNWQDLESEIADAVSILLIQRLKEAIGSFLGQYSDAIASPKGWAISRSSDKWGYCSPDGNLGFHWQLICCPKTVLEYVVVHELTHLSERNHSEKFWQGVKRVLPDYELQKTWLEVEGSRIAANYDP